MIDCLYVCVLPCMTLTKRCLDVLPGNVFYHDAMMLTVVEMHRCLMLLLPGSVLLVASWNCMVGDNTTD